MLTEIQKQLHKEFRFYLRTEKHQVKPRLDVLINAIEVKLPILMATRFNKSSFCLYDCENLQDMLLLSFQIKSNEDLIISHYNVAKAIDYYIDFYAAKNNLTIPNIIIPDIEDSSINTDEYLEGKEQDVESIRYERNKAARKKCIDALGCSCSICGFDFEAKYGELGRGFIEVHHIIPISQRGGNYVLNPIRDLIPVCSNCHSMIHRHREMISIPKLKHIVDDKKYF